MAFTNRDRQALILSGGVGLGAVAMYLLDPGHGKARRAALGHKTIRTWREVEAAAEISSKDIANRLTGVVADLWSAAQPRTVSDDVLTGRVRAKLGHVLTHPSSIQVKAEGGEITLTGHVLDHELEDLVQAVGSVRGVTSVRDQLEVHQHPYNLPTSRGGESTLHHWAPATRLLVGATGGLLALYGARRRGLLGFVGGTIGFGLLARAIGNREAKDLVGLGREGIAIQKTININAPLSDVFDFWADPENYPRVMSHIQEVRKIGENRYHWRVASPGGLAAEWEGTITRIVPTELVAWESLPGSLVANSGVARLDPNYDGSARLHIQMCYQPPGGMLGHLIAELFGADPKSVLDADLARLKSLFEHGKTRVRGQTVTLEEIQRSAQTQPTSKSSAA